ncbi:hypothetical protein NFI96_003517 [Prochilodus magdalenae]|nr:hypothetical protein NFI96_003517 [Prochilodus magdalenae]
MRVGLEVERHQAFRTILALTTVPPHTDSLVISTKPKAGLVTEDDPLEATQLLVQSLVISRLDYCNTLLAGHPLRASGPCNWSRTLQLDSSSIFQTMVESRSVPRALPASCTARLEPPSLRTHGRPASRLFSVLEPRWWNELPLGVRTAESLAVFKRRLKTHLFVMHLSISTGPLFGQCLSSWTCLTKPSRPKDTQELDIRPRPKEIQEQKRKKVIEIYQSGKGYKAISKVLGFQRTTVRAIIHKGRKRGTVVNHPRSGRPTKITLILIQEVTKDPTTTSKELQASLTSVKTAPDCHGGTQNGSGSSSVTSPALVLVETPNESVCGGTVVSTKMNVSTHGKPSGTGMGGGQQRGKSQKARERKKEWEGGGAREDGDKQMGKDGDTPTLLVHLVDGQSETIAHLLLHSAVLVILWSFISGHRTLLTGRCLQDAAHRTLPTGCAPQDAAHRTLPTGCCLHDASHRTLPTGRCPQDAAYMMRPTGRCPQDSAHRTLPT